MSRLFLPKHFTGGGVNRRGGEAREGGRGCVRACSVCALRAAGAIERCPSVGGLRTPGAPIHRVPTCCGRSWPPPPWRPSRQACSSHGGWSWCGSMYYMLITAAL
eukprot:COSAG01_NODE_36071_length_522_cov_5.328605_1_plen_104_part_10